MMALEFIMISCEMHVQVFVKLLWQAGIFKNTREAHGGANRSSGVPRTLLISEYISKQAYTTKLTITSLGKIC